MPAKPKKPTREAFIVTGEGDSAFWTRLGAVWPHDDGKGFNVELIALPVSGRLVLTVFVMAGLDPAIHLFRKDSYEE